MGTGAGILAGIGIVAAAGAAAYFLAPGTFKWIGLEKIPPPTTSSGGTTTGSPALAAGPGPRNQDGGRWTGGVYAGGVPPDTVPVLNRKGQEIGRRYMVDAPGYKAELYTPAQSAPASRAGATGGSTGNLRSGGFSARAFQ